MKNTYKIYISKPEKDVLFSRISLDDAPGNLQYIKTCVQVLYQEHIKNNIPCLQEFETDTDMLQIQDMHGNQYFLDVVKMEWVRPD